MKCRRCDKEFTPYRANQVYCSKECREPKNHNKAKGIELNVPPGTIGAISELAISVDLMSKGYQVFRCLSPHSFCDLIAFKNDEWRKIEVRTGAYNYKHDLFYSKNHNEGATEFGIYVPEDKSVHYIKINASLIDLTTNGNRTPSR